MMTKTAYYMQMAQEAAAQITGSKEQWTAFLTTSARLYKYPFAEQLMIYKQRPEATACAEYDLWKDRMNRYVKRGSKGIALLDMRGEQPKLRYVFDVADTGERKNSRPVQLWKMNAEHEQPIIRALDAAFDVPAGAGSLENHIMEAAERLARDYWEENRRQISDIVADSYLEGYDELNIGASFKRAAAVSIAYSVFTRTVGNADDYFEHEDFLDIFDFNTQAAANVLGTAVSEMSSQIFREIERTIRTYERDKQAERSQNYDGAELHEERRLPDSGHPVVGAGTEAPGQVREDAQSVSAGEQHAAVQSPDPDREAVPAPVGDSGDRDRTDGADDGGSSESESGTGQEIEPDGLGAAHEHAESAGRGSHSDGTYQQLNFMSLFQSEAEQIQKIDAAAENAAKEAESEKPSAFVISEDEIDRMPVSYTHLLQSQNERMFLLTFLVMNTGETEQELETNVFQASSIAQKYNCNLRRLDFQQEQGLMSCLPLAQNLIEIQRSMTTSSTAIFVPFTTQELFQTGKEALYYGLNALSNNLIMVDRKKLKNPNGLILGTPGSGKSFSAKREIANAFLVTDDDVKMCIRDRSGIATAEAENWCSRRE